VANEWFAMNPSLCQSSDVREGESFESVPYMEGTPRSDQSSDVESVPFMEGTPRSDQSSDVSDQSSDQSSDPNSDKSTPELTNL
jgi:hypothetical protein